MGDPLASRGCACPRLPSATDRRRFGVWVSDATHRATHTPLELYGEQQRNARASNRRSSWLCPHYIAQARGYTHLLCTWYRRYEATRPLGLPSTEPLRRRKGTAPKGAHTHQNGPRHNADHQRECRGDTALSLVEAIATVTRRATETGYRPVARTQLLVLSAAREGVRAYPRALGCISIEYTTTLNRRRQRAWSASNGKRHPAATSTLNACWGRTACCTPNHRAHHSQNHTQYQHIARITPPLAQTFPVSVLHYYHYFYSISHTHSHCSYLV